MDGARTEPDQPSSCGIGDVAAMQRCDSGERLREQEDRGSGEAHSGSDVMVCQQYGQGLEPLLVGGDRRVVRRGRPRDLQPPRCRVRVAEPIYEPADGAAGAGTSRQPFIEQVLSQIT